MNRASPATGWVRNPVMKSPELDPTQASSYDLGWTYNPLTGCLNHTNGMCKGGSFPCYAYKLANGRLKSRYLANWKNIAPVNNPDSFKQANDALNDPFYPRFWPERLQDLNVFRHHHHKKRRGIFVCDMSDLFGIGIPDDWTRQVLRACEYNLSDRFYLLTKQPQNLIKFLFPDNCWVGVTATHQGMFNEALVALDSVKAKVKYISFEPLLDKIVPFGAYDMNGEVDWVIIGAQTKPYKPPEISWVEEIVRACDKAGVKVFLKDNLKPLLCKSGQGIYIPQWARGNRELRQEMPW